MSLERIALITENDQLARFFEIEMELLSYVSSRFHTISELVDDYDCIIIDNDTVFDAIGAHSCPIVNVSVYFDAADALQQPRLLPWPTRINDIRRALQSIERETVNEDPIQKSRRFNNDTVYITDPNTNSIMIENMRAKLTPNEMAVLSALCLAEGEVVARDDILRIIGANDGNIVDVYICRLRKKLEEPLKRKLIFSVRGSGYKTVLSIKNKGL